MNKEENFNPKEFKKAIDDFLEENFSNMGNEPKILHGSLSAFKSLLPYKDYEWTRKVENGQYYFEIKSRDNNNVMFYVTEHVPFD